jgi:ATP-dependent Lon protease
MSIKNAASSNESGNSTANVQARFSPAKHDANNLKSARVQAQYVLSKVGEHDYHLHVVELHNSGPTAALTLSAFVTLCSGVMGKAIQQQMVVLGSMSLGGNIVPVENLAESLQVALDSGARRILLPMASVRDIPTIPGELFAKFQTSFYSDPTDAVFKALGVQ